MFAPARQLVTEKWKLIFWGSHEPIGVKFRMAKRTHVLLGFAKLHVNRFNECTPRGENANFWPVSKFNIGRLPLRGILQVKTKQKKQ